jgi:hypothetical protein
MPKSHTTLARIMQTSALPSGLAFAPLTPIASVLGWMGVSDPAASPC